MRHKPIEVQARRQQVASLYLMGWYQTDIAAEVGISQQQVSHDLKAIRAAWHTSMLQDFTAAQAQELERISLVERAAWVSWEKSKQEREITVQEKNNGKTKVSRRLEGQTGDPRYLELVLKCSERRCTLLGLDAARKFTINWDTVTDTQLEQLARGEPVASVLAQPAPAPLAEA